MLLNAFEFALMNNPVRAWVQQRFEAPRLLRLGGAMDGGTALEVGCGRGRGVETILKQFGASAVDAFDLDLRMIVRALRRLSDHQSVHLWVADCTAIPVPSAHYDAVFDFGIIHHVPDWRAALAEITRVLKPGGRFYAEEVLVTFLENAVVRRLFEHPRSRRFEASEFVEGMRDAGLAPQASKSFGNSFAWFTASKPLTRG